jgi:hypothetical protein
MVQANTLDGRFVAWAVPADRRTGAPAAPAWVLRATEAMRGAGARVELVAVAGGAGPATTPSDLPDDADVFLATTMAIGHRLAEGGLERFRLWTFLQGAPGRSLQVTEDSERRLREAVASSRKVLVFDEDARSTVESTIGEAASRVIVFPDDGGAEPTGFRAGRTGDPALVINLDLTAALGLDAATRHADRVRAHRGTRPVFLVCSPDLQAELRVNPVYRQFAAIPGARAVSPDDASLASALGGVRPLGFLPRPRNGAGHRITAARLWFEARGIELFAEHGALPAVPRQEPVRYWSAETLTEDLAGLDGQPATEPPAVRGLAEDLGEVLGPYLPDYTAVPRRTGTADRTATRTRVLLVGADFKFAGEIIEALAQRDDLEVRVDRWQTNGGPIPEDNEALLDWAEVILCEFASRNAVWYSQKVRPDQRLLLHLHGYELRQPPVHEIKIDAVETVVFASEFYRAKALDATGWPREKTSVIPNQVQVSDLARTKLPDARFHLGLAGYVPELKRPDRALDLLELLLDRDDRYVLHLRGHNPWNYGFVWRHPLRRDAYLAFYERLQRDACLRRSVVFDVFGADMGNWFRGIGWTLSPSTRETFHLAPVEGMASGAVPVVWRREGSEEIFPERWNVGTTAEAAQFILDANHDRDGFARLSSEASDFAARYGAPAVTARWLDLIVHGRVPRAPGAVAGTAAGPSVPPEAARRDEDTERWEDIRSLASAGRFTLAQGLLGVDAERPWLLDADRRLLVGEVIGIPALRQRAHRLHGVVRHAPLRRADGNAVLVCGPDLTPDTAVGPFAAGAPSGLSVLRLPAARDNADAVFDEWVDVISRRALQESAGEVYALGDEVTALACTVAASRLGLDCAWDLAGDSSVAASLAEAAADPYRADDRGVVALMAARHADRIIGAPVPGLAGRAPIEDRVRRPRLQRPPRIGLIGDDLSLEALDRPLEGVRLGLSDGGQRIRDGLDALLISGEGARDARWIQRASGTDTVLDRLIGEARRYNVPIGLMDDTSADLDPVLRYARRVDAVLAPGAEDVARLHDRRIVPTQVATALPAAQPSVRQDGEPAAPTSCLLSRDEGLELMVRLLRVNQPHAV